MPSSRSVNSLSIVRLLVLVATAACTDAVSPRSLQAPGNPAQRDIVAGAALETFYGPEQFIRGHGAPQVVTRTISTARFEAPFILHVRSGDASGANAASSATVTFDGAVLLGPNDFNNHGSEWALPVNPGLSATLTVSIAGAPGSILEIWLEGKRSTPVFCPTGRPGAYATLGEAVNAALVNGTVLVCDGEYVVDTTRIRKPVTIRSEHPGGATIRDADQGPLSLQQGRASLIIDSVPSGLVRLVDLGFKMSGRSIKATGLFDQVAIDSSHIVGIDSVSSIPIEVFASSVLGARVEVTNTHFEHFAIGVFVVAAVETNVRSNVFENSNSAGVTYSSDGTAGGSSFGSAEDNVFKTCGSTGCLRVVSGGRSITIARNTFTALAGPSRTFGILVRRSETLARDPMVIEDNEFIGAALAGDPTLSTNWTAQSALEVDDAPGVVNIVRRNRFTNVHTGIVVATDVDAQDNLVTGGVFAFRQTAARAVSIRRNDFVAQAASFRTVNPAGAFQCNYWGSSGGPSNPQVGVNSSAYTPWSYLPIANSGTSCDPNAPAPSTVRVCSTTGTDPSPTVSKLTVAMSLVASGGTVKICDGTYTVFNVNLNPKSMTIEGEGPGLPILDAAGNGNVFTMNSSTPISTAIILRKLRLQNAAFSDIGVQGNYGSVLADQIEFHPAHGTPPGTGTLAYSDGVGVFSATGAGVTVQNSTFDGGDIGVHVNNAANIVIVNNSFTNHLNAAIHAGNGGSLTASNNTITNCGPFWCIGIFNGPGQVGTFKFYNNSITTDYAHPVINGIQADGGNYVMDGNVISGIGGTRDPHDASTWPITYSGIDVGMASAELVRNVIVGAYNGLGLEGASGTATDNTIHDVASLINLYNANMAVHRNDFYNFTNAFDHVPALSPGSSATCNWWGSTSGPQGIDGSVSPALYTPWATQPIAMVPGVICQ
jgi:Right handed beta helix region